MERNDLIQEIKKTLLNKNNKITPWHNRKKEYATLKNEIILHTSFLEKDRDLIERIHCLLNNITELPMCPVCKKTPLTYYRSLNNYSRTCSQKCVLPETFQIRKETTINNGNLLIGSKEFIEKSKITKKERYNNESYCNSEKAKITCLTRYGVDNPAKSEAVKKKISQNTKNSKKLRNIYGEDIYSLLNNPDILEQLNSKSSIREISKKTGIKYTTLWSKFYKKLKLKYHNSGFENEVAEFIEKYIDIKRRDRSLGFEIDILIEKKNLAIECNGIYWHSYDNFETSAQKNKHLTRSKKCQDNNLFLLHIFEHEWENKKEIVKSIILNKIGVYHTKYFARKLQLREVTTKEANLFYEDNHIQGGSSNIGKSLGLFNNNELVQCMSIGKSRFNKNDIELTRMCNKINTIVVGGNERLFAYFIRTQDYKKLISYCDISKFSGKSYLKMGFSYVGDTKPNYVWCKHLNTLSRYQTQKHKLKDFLMKFDNSLSEAENMFANKYRRLWNCGNKKFIWTSQVI